MKTSIFCVLLVMCMLVLSCKTSANFWVNKRINTISTTSDTCKQGLWVSSDSSKNIIIGFYRNCQLNGKVKTLFASGETCIVTYKNGLKHGVSKYYRRDGVVYLVQNYANGKISSGTTLSPKW